MESIFMHKIGDRNCYSLDVQSRLDDIKHCKDIDALQFALDSETCQKTVERAIVSRIKKLKAGQV